MMIVKVQRPSAWTTGFELKALVYDKARSFMEWLPLDESIVQRFHGKDSLKFYCEAARENGVLVLGKRVPPEAW